MTGKAGAPLTEAMFYVLMALRRGELCGTEIAAWAERCTEGRVRLGPGTLYTILGRFLEEGFIQETSVQGRRRNYRLTEKGQRAYRNERLRLRLCLADAEREDAGRDYDGKIERTTRDRAVLCPVWFSAL
ncbi:MAG: PadR family transcriptional regulator [Vescimonas sp.]